MSEHTADPIEVLGAWVRRHQAGDAIELSHDEARELHQSIQRLKQSADRLRRQNAKVRKKIERIRGGEDPSED